MKYTKLPLIFAPLLVVYSAQAATRLPAPNLCLTFGQSIDVFEGEVSPRRSKGGFFALAMLEFIFDRAAYGTLALDGGVYRIGLTKNTNTATVAYQCDIPVDTLNGQCNILVFSTTTSTATRLTDVGFLNFGVCPVGSAAAETWTQSVPAGEEN